MARRAGFTLIEILVSLAIFAIVIAAVGGSIFSVFWATQRQRDYQQCLENGRWLMEFMANEARQAEFFVQQPQNNRIRIRAANNIWYWQGDGGILGPNRIIFRGIGNAIANANNFRQEISNFVVNVNFNVNGDLLTIQLTLRPNPDLPSGPGNQDYILRTQVRQRQI